MTPTRRGRNGATQTSGRLPNPRHARARVDGRGVHEVRRDLDARDEVAARDDLAVERGEDLERVDPVEALELGDADVEDARGLGEQVDPALVRAADRQAGPGHRGREPDGRLVLVELARLGDEDADRVARIGALPIAARSSALSRRPFDQRSPPIVRSRARTAPTRRAGTRRPGVTRWTCTRVVWRSVPADLAPQRGLDRASCVDDGHRAFGSRGRRGCRC